MYSFTLATVGLFAFGLVGLLVTGPVFEILQYKHKVSEEVVNIVGCVLQACCGLGLLLTGVMRFVDSRQLPSYGGYFLCAVGALILCGVVVTTIFQTRRCR